MITIKKDALKYREPETGEFVGVNLLGGTGGDGLSQTLKTAIYNLLMDAVYQSSNHASDRAALAELLNGSSGGDNGDTGEDGGGDDNGGTGGDEGGGTTDNRTILHNWDFTSSTPMVDTIAGVEAAVRSGNPVFDYNGVTFAATDCVNLITGISSLANRVIEIDVASVPTALAAAHLRLMTFTGACNTGLICRNTTHFWSFYSASWNESTIAQNAVAGKTIRLEFDAGNNCTAYMDDAEIITSTAFTLIENVVLGATSNSANGITVSGVRIYEKEA